ncbi:MAG: homoserine kinase [Bradymonadia bacterium]
MSAEFPRQTLTPTRAFAPATIGNISVGYDLLGAAVRPVDDAALGDAVEVHAAAEDSLRVTGAYGHLLDDDHSNNLVMRALHAFRQAVASTQSRPPPPLRLVLEKGLPIGSGLGSSACSIVAALVALNESHGRPINPPDLLDMMGALEGTVSGTPHLDNVAPAFLGGIQLLVDEAPQRSFSIPPIAGWFWVLCHPGVVVATAAARAVMPDVFSSEETLAFGRGLGAFIHASHSGDSQLAARVLRDPLAEPRRRHLLPHLSAARSCAEAKGALATGISGSGPTVFAVAPSLEVARDVAAAFEREVVANPHGFVHVCRVDDVGARIEVIG